MPAVLALLPAALLALGAFAGWLTGQRGGRWAAAAGAWAATTVLVAQWSWVHSPVELAAPGFLGLGLGPPSGGGFRLDALSFAFTLALLLPGALLLTFQARRAGQAALAALVLAAAVLAALADGLTGSALWFGAAGALLLVQLRAEAAAAARAYWPAVVAGWLALTWAGAALEALGGTSVFAAVPVTALNVPLELLVAGGVALATGLVPWSPWTTAAWESPRAPAGPLAVVVVRPLGFLLLLRLYEVAGGSQPSLPLEIALAGLGLAMALSAAWRAHTAGDRRAALGELVPLASGAALLALGVGTAAGITAAVMAVASGGLLAVVITLLPAGSRAWPAAVLLIAALPPGLPFAARLLGLQAALESGNAWGFSALAMAVAWVLGIAATVRAVRIAERGAPAAGSRVGVLLAGLPLVAAGPAAGVVVGQLAGPAARVVTGPQDAVGGGATAITTVSGSWPAAEVGIPALLLLAGAAYAAARWGHRPAPATTRPALPVPDLARWRSHFNAAAGWRLPADYSSLFNPAALEKAMARGRPALWAVLVLILAIVVTR